MKDMDVRRAVNRLMTGNLQLFSDVCFAELHPSTRLIPSPFYNVITNRLLDVFEGRTKRLIINLPPRSLKSLLASIALPAYWLGHRPSAKIICASYGQDLAETFSRETLTFMKSKTYRGLFPNTALSGSKQTVHEFATTQGGSRKSTSVQGVLTGFGADLIIIDDPIKPDEALSDARRNSVNKWFDSTVLSRLNDKVSGAIIVIMQRVHEDDLTGHLLQKGGWEVLSLPAIAERDEHYDFRTPFGPSSFRRQAGEALHPEREPLSVLAELRRTMGEYDFAGQYQQAPAPAEGGMVKRDWFRLYGPNECPDRFDTVVQSWDTASKVSELSDYSVCTTWGVVGHNLYLLHVLRKRLDYPSLKRAVAEQATLHAATVILIEDKSSGTQLIQELIASGCSQIRACNPLADKKMRLHAQTGKIENGFVYVPREADWLDAYLHEMTVFPRGRHDDQVDSTSQALEWLQTGQSFTGIIDYFERLLAESAQANCASESDQGPDAPVR